MPNYGMLIDTSKCVGCFSCRVGCQRQNGLAPEETFIKMMEVEQGTFPNVVHRHFFMQCNHCDNAPCIKVCPTKASYKREDGVVMVNDERCIGCKNCMTACPYQVRTQIHSTGVVNKCRFCIEEVEQGNQPFCVRVCIGGARVFGDLDDPNSKISKEIVKRRAQPLRTDLGTKPKIYFAG